MLSPVAAAALEKLENTSLQVISHRSSLVRTIPMDQEDAELQRDHVERVDGAQFQWGVVISPEMVSFRLRFWLKSGNVQSEVDVALNWDVKVNQRPTDAEVKALMVEYGAAATHGAALAILHSDLQLLATNIQIRFSIEAELSRQVEENFDHRIVRLQQEEASNEGAE
ncbi:hypothetical protein [Dietzia sp. Alg238-R159]|uniref:hypothetical protein n=1 Tax=Dietzia sp. Alg238-R159 TaxID=2305986 RepID=UPI0013D7E181|nr:hypothetical protein [Dietzia sp. Alg238-R159]